MVLTRMRTQNDGEGKAGNQKWESHGGQEKGGSETSNTAWRVARSHHSTLSRGLGLLWPTPHARSRVTDERGEGTTWLGDRTSSYSWLWVTRRSFWCTESLGEKSGEFLSAECRHGPWVHCEKSLHSHTNPWGGQDSIIVPTLQIRK